jgi:hypothetical protein
MPRSLKLPSLCIVAIIALFNVVSAQYTGHYVNGVEGIKAASLPPPGLYLRLYMVSYDADTMKAPDGTTVEGLGFDLGVFATVGRLVWVTDKKLLGANYAMDVIFPYTSTHLQMEGADLNDRQSGLADIAIEPLVLSWNRKRFDTSFGVAFYLPSGDFSLDEPASPGKDFGTTMLTLGGTYYLDEARLWAASILSRYEMHGYSDATGVSPGDDFHFEWGVSRNLKKLWDLGLTGYCQWQVSADKGATANEFKDQVFAAGPEVSKFFPKAKLVGSLRAQWEFGAEDRPQGRVLSMTLTKIF